MYTHSQYRSLHQHMHKTDRRDHTVGGENLHPHPLEVPLPQSLALPPQRGWMGP